MQKEIWKDIEGYGNLYQISNFGRVKSLSKLVFNGKVYYILSGRILKNYITKGGYFRRILRKNNKSKNCFIHRLVLNAFVGESKLQCNHKNGIKTDNRLENLEWITPKENMKHAIVIGLHKGIKGSKNVKSKLTESQVQRIKFIAKNCKVGYGYWLKLSKSLNVSLSTVKNVLNNKAWVHISI